ncbi:MAG: hypothetical protein RBR74_13155 [Ignavibacteriaceae bacterium]|jgi:hypothetical protein|nr:hypothetical protein [Ignavibacteriaceae bacterium]
MEKPNVKYRSELVNYQPVKTETKDNSVSMDDDQINPVVENLLVEGGENFYHYINWLGLNKDPNLMILSSVHHYYYDFNDLKGVKTLINLKRLNQISHLETFLNNVFRVLPSKANFVGCFKDNKIRGGIGVPFYQSFKLLNGLVNMIDSKTDRFMTRKYVIKLLESHDFRLIDMTEISNITFFCAESHKRNPHK